MTLSELRTVIWAEALGPDCESLTTYENSVLVDTKSAQAHHTEVKQLRDALKQRDVNNIVIWSGYLLSTLHKYVAKVGRMAMDKTSRYEQIPEEASKSRDDFRKVSLLETRIEQAEISQEPRAALGHARTAVRELVHLFEM